MIAVRTDYYSKGKKKIEKELLKDLEEKAEKILKRELIMKKK